MSVKWEQICRLCLKLTKNDCKDVDDTVKLMFHVLMLKLDLDITTDPIICQDCMEVAERYLDFKYTCVNTERVILSFSIGVKNVIHDIKAVCRDGEDIEAIVDEDFNICRFCMTQLGRNHCVSLNSLMNDTIYEMLSEYFPEMDFKIIENPTICTTCREKLEGYFQFVLNCLGIEAKIKSFRKEKRTGKIYKIKLCDVLRFLSSDILEYSNKCLQIGNIKQGSNRLEDTECMYPEVYNALIKQEELGIKEEKTDEYTYQQKIQVNILGEASIYRDDLKVNESNNIQTNHGVRANSTEQIKHIKSSLTTNNSASEMDIYKHGERVSYPKHKNNANGSSFIQNNVQSCVSVHKSISKTKICKRQLLVHKEVSEIKTFKCSSCAYESKNRNNLSSHMLVHKDVSEIKMFRCSLCAYETKYKRSLVRHMLVHKDAKMYKCSLCTYEAKWKSHFERHMLVHKDVSEMKKVSCSFCDHKSKHKKSLVKHMLIHKDISEIQMFTCSVCGYESKYKSDLTKHKLVHMDISEIKMFTCSLCDYKAKYKGSLKNHMLVHKDISEIDMFTCSLCTYKSKYKGGLKTHMLVHKNVSERYKCSLCASAYKYETSLKRHILLSHKDI